MEVVTAKGSLPDQVRAGDRPATPRP